MNIEIDKKFDAKDLFVAYPSLVTKKIDNNISLDRQELTVLIRDGKQFRDIFTDEIVYDAYKRAREEGKLYIHLRENDLMRFENQSLSVKERIIEIINGETILPAFNVNATRKTR